MVPKRPAGWVLGMLFSLFPSPSPAAGLPVPAEITRHPGATAKISPALLPTPLQTLRSLWVGCLDETLKPECHRRVPKRSGFAFCVLGRDVPRSARAGSWLPAGSCLGLSGAWAGEQRTGSTGRRQQGALNWGCLQVSPFVPSASLGILYFVSWPSSGGIFC